MDASFFIEALNEAIIKYGKPEIINTDQRAEFTGKDWITILTNAKIQISLDGRGRYLDNIFIERLWRSLNQSAKNLTRVYLSWIISLFRKQDHFS